MDDMRPRDAGVRAPDRAVCPARSTPARRPFRGAAGALALAAASCAAEGSAWSQPSGATAAACVNPADSPHPTPAAYLSVARLTIARCVLADLDGGRFRDADDRLAAARTAATQLSGADRLAWQALVVRLDATRHADEGRWPDLTTLVLPDEAALPWAGPLVRGVAAARASWSRQDAALQALARAQLRRLEALAAQAGPVSEAERARLVVQGAMAGAQYEREEMQLLLDAAHDLEVRLSGADELRTPIVLAWEIEADLLRVTDRYAAAGERYRDVLVEWPRRVQSRVGLALAYEKLGYAREAAEARAQALALWAAADADALAAIR